MKLPRIDEARAIAEAVSAAGGREVYFYHHWQDYRTRKDRSLKTVSDAGHVYQTPGKHSLCVKAVYVFGCDTSTTVVEVTV